MQIEQPGTQGRPFSAASTPICFNPDCPYTESRIVSTNPRHQAFETCQPWTSTISQLRNINNQLIESILTCGQPITHLDFYASPLASLKTMYAIYKMNWQCTLEYYVEQIRKEILHELKAFTERMKNDMEEVLKKSECYSKMILFSDMDQNTLFIKIDEEMQRIQEDIEQLGHKVLFNHEKMVKSIGNIKDQIHKLSEAFLSNEVPQLKVVCREDEDRRKFEEFLDEDTDSPFSKIQILASAFGIQPKTYITEGTMTSLSCFLCIQVFKQAGESNKKQLKKTLTQTVLSHIKACHLPIALINYRRKILKSFVREVSLNEMLSEVKQGKHTQIQIIDRENAGNYENYDPRKYIIEVVSQKNVNLAKGKYIAAKSSRKDAADILIVFMAKDLFNVRKLTLTLVTEDHFGEAMKDICGSFGQKIVIVNGKKQNGG